MKNPVFDIENWREIAATLARNKTRTFLTAFGIFWGTAMLAMLMGGANGMEGMLRRNFDGFATNIGAIFPQRTTLSYRGFNKGMAWSLTSTDVENIRRSTPYLESTTPISGDYATIVYATKSVSGNCVGVEPDYTAIMNPVIYSGRFINANDEADSRKVAVIGRNLANDLFGSEDPVGRYVSINGVYMLIVGVAGQKSEISLHGRIEDSIIIPASTLRRALTHSNNVDAFVFTVKAPHSPADVIDNIRRAIMVSHPINPADHEAVYLFDASENFAKLDNLFLGINLLAIFVGAGSLMAGVIGVGNIMWIIVKERTQEIGIRRAIGAKPRDIIVQILSESIVLTTVAGLSGITFATIVLSVADSLTADPVHGSAHFLTSFVTATGILIIFFVLGTVAGTLPAIKAMKIKPIEAMRDR